MHIKPGYDRHQGLFEFRQLPIARTISRRAEGGPSSCHLCATDESQVGLCSGGSGAIIGVGASD
jgi:hypothetical protein